jgi:hypothetical protein
MDYPVEQLIELDETKSFLRAARRYCSFIELTAKTDGSTDVVVGHFRFGSAGQRPPRVSMAMPIRASGLW